MRRVYLLLLLVLLLPLTSAFGQGTDEKKKAFIDTALSRIFAAINERENQLSLEHAQRKEAEAEARQKVFNLGITRLTTNQALADIDKAAKAISTMPVTYSTEYSETLASNRLNAEKTISDMAREEDAAKSERNSRRDEVVRSEDELRKAVSSNSEMKGGLKALNANWLTNPTAGNFNSLLSAVTSAANNTVVTSDINITTQNNLGPTTGARVRFEGWDERTNGQSPRFSCVISTTLCTEKKVGVGIYYFWTERDGNVTSDKEFWQDIGEPIEDITIIENH